VVQVTGPSPKLNFALKNPNDYPWGEERTGKKGTAWLKEGDTSLQEMLRDAKGIKHPDVS